MLLLAVHTVGTWAGLHNRLEAAFERHGNHQKITTCACHVHGECFALFPTFTLRVRLYNYYYQDEHISLNHTKTRTITLTTKTSFFFFALS